MGGKTDGCVNRMFTQTDSFVAHTIRSDILVRLARRENLLAVLRRHVTEGSRRWVGECRHDAGSKTDLKICVRAAVYDQSNWRYRYLHSIGHCIRHFVCKTKYYS